MVWVLPVRTKIFATRLRKYVKRPALKGKLTRRGLASANATTVTIFRTVRRQPYSLLM